METSAEMLNFVKALANADRLKIVGILVQKPAPLLQIIEGLSLQRREAFKHLEYMKRVGVINEIDGLYELNTTGLETLARRQFEEKDPANTPNPDLEINQQKILARFLNPDGAIRQIPNSRTQYDRFRIMLEYILAAFEPGITYTEKEVNTIIHRFHEDVAGLRRDLIEEKMLMRERDGSKYWRPEPAEGKKE